MPLQRYEILSRRSTTEPSRTGREVSTQVKFCRVIHWGHYDHMATWPPLLPRCFILRIGTVIDREIILERDSLTVSALACHAADPGSNPAQGDDFVN